MADEQKTHEVFEVFGPSATSRGWDFQVCRSMQECQDLLNCDLDSLEDGEEVRVVYRKYTQAQMDEVVFE